jgi:hypothetical protein
MRQCGWNKTTDILFLQRASIFYAVHIFVTDCHSSPSFRNFQG